MVEPYEQFEQEWAKFHGVPEAVACSTGTAALHLAVLALGIGPGDEVIVPEFTMVASANAVTYTGAKPVFVDCDDTLNIDVHKIEEKITERTKAIMVVHVYGKPCDMDMVMGIAERHGIPVIEDAAEAHGARYRGELVGTIGNIGCFSHYKNKIIAAEEGGSCVTHSKEYAERMRSLRSHAFDEGHTFLHTELGFNYRMTNATARQLLLQDWRALVQERKNPDGSVNWVRETRLYDTEEARDIAFKELQDAGENPRLFFKPMSMQPMYYDENYKNLKAYDFSKRGLYLPWK